MEGFGESENSKGRQPWTTDMMRENRDKWSLAADVGVLQYLEQFSNKLLNETENTLNLMDSFESELNTSCVQVSNITNRFLSLADSQFVENRVYDDEETPTPDMVNTVPNVPVKSKQEVDSEIFSRLKESVNNGLTVLSTKFEAVEVVNSDSEDDDSGPMGVVYKPINVFNNRPLPHLIGSVEFLKDPTVGLEELPSDDEESIEEESSSESKELTEENEDSEPESDRPNIILPNNNIHNVETADLLFKQPSSSFADHLAKRLENMENESRLPKQPTRNVFSTTPPPLDDSCEDDFGSNEDLIFGGNNRNDFHDNDDLFVPKSKSDGYDDLFESKSNTSFWDDDNKNDVLSNDVETIPSSIDNRKKVMQDLEKRFSQNFKTSEDNLSDDISPSPPPLNDDGHNEDYASKLKNKEPTSLFNYNPEDNNESDDLFGSVSKNITSVSSSSKKKILPGAVNVMGNNADIFKNSIKQRGTSSAVSKSDTNEDKTESDVIAKAISSIRRNNDDDYEEDDEDSLFKSSNNLEKSSSRSSSVKLSESFQDDNISIKSNKSAGLFDDILTNTKNNSSIKKTMDDLFSDLNNCDDEDDDLFSSNFSSKGNKNSNIFSTLGNNTNSFSSGNSTSAVNRSNAADDLFSDIDTKDDLFSNFTKTRSDDKKSSESKINKPVATVIAADKKPLSLFDDEEDDTDIFGSDFLISKSISSSNSKKVNDIEKSTVIVKNKEKVSSAESAAPEISIDKSTKKSGGLFGDDLFGETRSPDEDIFSSDLFSKKPSKVAPNLANENKKSVKKPDSVDNDLFLDSDNTISNNSILHSDKQTREEKLDNLATKDDSSLFVKANESTMNNSESRNHSKIPAVSNKNIKTANVKPISLFSDNVDSFPENNDDLFKTCKVTSANHMDDSFHKNSEATSKILSSNLSSDHTNAFSDKKASHEDDDVESDIFFSKPSKSSDLFAANNSSNNYHKVPASEDFIDVPPLPDASMDDSPLFSDDKNNSITFDGNNINEDLFRKRISNSKNYAIEELENKLPSDADLKVDAIVNDIESDDVLFKKSVTPVPYRSTNEVSSDNIFSDNSANDNIFSGKSDVSNDKSSSLFDKNKNSGISDKNSSVMNKQNSNIVESSKGLFDTNHSLPKIPSEPTKKPHLPVKPSKPEPPKSLSIRAPISSPDPFGSNSNKIISIKAPMDVPDGGVFSSESTTLPSPRITPGKLNLEKSLNINPKALLPGARPASFKKSSSPPTENENPESSKNFIISPSTGENAITLDSDSREGNLKKCPDLSEKGNLSGSSSLPNADSVPVLHSIAKDRAKIQVKRRPQTRKARQEAIRQSTIENNNYEDDETDNSSSITTQSNVEPKSTSSSIFDQASNILSPSTDEEDLFGVPPLDLPPDYSKVSISPGDIFDAPTIISPDLNAANSNDNSLSGNVDANENKNVLNSSRKENYVEDIFESNSNDNSTMVINNPAEEKEVSNEIFNDVTDHDDKAKLATTDVGVVTTNKIKSNPVSNSLFSDIDDSDLFENKSEKPVKTVSDESDLFFNKPSKHKTNLDDVTIDSDLFSNKLTEDPVKIANDDSDLFSNNSNKSRGSSNNTITNDEPNLFFNKSDKSKENPLSVVNEETDLFSSRSNELKGNLDNKNISTGIFLSESEKSDSDITNKALKEGSASNNIICGVFNSGVVNICDKLSITPPKDDELFPPSDWTINNKKENTVISVPEKMKTDSLFVNDKSGLNDVDGDNLFSASNPSSSTLKGNLNVSRKNSNDSNKNKTKLVNDLFSDDDDESLFGEVKVKNDPPIQPKSSASSFQNPKSSSDNKIKKSSAKSKSLFGDDGEEDDSDIFGSSLKSKSVSNPKFGQSSNDSLKHASNLSGSAVKKSNTIKSTKLTPAATKKDEGFIDPLAALGSKD